MPKTNLNIYKRKDGRYEGRYFDGYKLNGEKKRHSVYGTTYEQVKARLEAIYSSMVVAVNEMMTVKELMDTWIDALKCKTKESTISNYLFKANKHIIPEFGGVMCCDLNVAAVQCFINKKLESGLSEKYVTDMVIMLKSMFKYAARVYGYPNIISAVVMPKKKRNDIHILSAQNKSKLKAYLYSNPNIENMGILLTLCTGLRVGELCGLQWEDIDFENKLLAVNRTIQRIPVGNGKTAIIANEPKSETSKRIIPIPDMIMPLLRIYQESSEKYVLSGSDKPFEPRRIQYYFQRLLTRLGLPSVHFHALRHMFATDCIKSCCDIKDLSEVLGHSSVEITLNRYVHSSMAQKREMINRLTAEYNDFTPPVLAVI